MSALFQDLRYSLRILRKEPGFTVPAVLTLAISLGANTAVFSVMNGVLLRALPYPESDRIMDVAMLVPPGEGRPSHKDYLDSHTLRAWRKRARTVEQLAGYQARSLTLTGQGEPERLIGASVSPALFPLLRVAPARGRGFREEEERPGLDRLVILSDGLWWRRFQGDPKIVGKTVTLEGQPHSVVGVMPRSFFFPNHEVQLWTPLSIARPAQAVGVVDVEYFPVAARLRDGASREQAEAEAQGILRGMGRRGAAPGKEAMEGRVQLAPLRDEIVAEVRPALLAMFVAVGLVLVIACINLAGLLLARNASRQRELAIRSAVGGSRGRLVRQALTESTFLSLAGGSVGLLVAGWIHHLLPRILPHDLPRIEEVHLDARVLLFAVSLSAVTGLVFGLVPALRSSGANLVRPLHGGVAESLPGLPAQGLFVVAEIALAFVLLVGAGLLLRSFLHLVEIDLGYEPDHVLTATLDLDAPKYRAPGRGEALIDDLLGRLTEHQHVKAAGVVSFPPLTPNFSLTTLQVRGQPRARTMAVLQLSSPGYLRAIGLRLSSGRWLTAQDQDHAAPAPVAVVNATFVRQYVMGQEAVGQRLELGSASLEIVGVIKDVRLLGLDSDPKPEIFTSFRHAEKISGGPKRLTLAIRTGGDPLALVPFLRASVLELDPDLALEDVRTMDARLDASLAQPRFYALLLGVFAGMALVLASAGVYGVLSYAVARQTQAIGVRRALGARRAVILAMVLRKGFMLVLMGLVIGMAAAAGATRVLAHLLYGVTTRDPLSSAVAALSLVGVTFFACYLPALRATRVEPAQALRYDR